MFADCFAAFDTLRYEGPESTSDLAIQSNRAPEPASGRQEWLANLINRF